MEVKKCIKCNISKNATQEFFKFRKDTNKLNNICRECVRKQERARYKAKHGENKVIKRQREAKELLKLGLIKCSKCGLELDKGLFSLQANNPTTGRASACRECTEESRDRISSRLKDRCKRYGITPDSFYKMKEEQDSKCLICNSKEDDKGLHIDHCHSTGKVRGLLCKHCNTAIGSLREDINLFERAIKYLKDARD